MYQIKDYSFIQADRLGVKIRPSKKANYKIDVLTNDDNLITRIGDKRYSDFPTFYETKGEEFALNRRRLYHIRHKNDATERGFFAKNILW
jgi:hypothetical protein